MDTAEFDRRLRGMLCWVDGSPTHESSHGQRQCRRCRRKWSYRRLQAQWTVAEAFCAERSRREAAAVAGIDVHTAGRHYARYQRLLAEQLLERAVLGANVARADSPSVLLQIGRIERAPSTRRRLPLVAGLAFWGMPYEARLCLLYRLAFEPKISMLQVSAQLAGR